MAIDFTLSPEQLQLQANARAFAEAVLAPIAEQLDAIADPAEAFYSTRAAFREMAKAGFRKSFIPVADGGLGFGLVDFALAAEELARVDVNVPTTLLASGVGLRPVIQFGDAAQRKLFLQPFVEDADGELLAAFAFTEVGGGRSEEHTSELQSLAYLVCRLLLEKKKHTGGTEVDCRDFLTRADGR